jgi:peroxiredoxin
MTLPAIGSPAPDFTLETTSGSTVRLSDFRGKQHVLLAFFPLAFTGTCTAEICAFSEDYSQFVSKGVAVVPISVDSTATLKEFKAKHGVKIDLASDFKREVSRAWGVLNPEKFFANRSYFLVDKSGVVRWSHVEAVNGQRRETAQLLAQIAKLGA